MPVKWGVPLLSFVFLKEFYSFSDLILSADTHFVLVDKIPTLVNSVISRNCAADILKTEESCRICHSSISNCKNTDSIWLSSLDTDNNNSKCLFVYLLEKK